MCFAPNIRGAARACKLTVIYNDHTGARRCGLPPSPIGAAHLVPAMRPTWLGAAPTTRCDGGDDNDNEYDYDWCDDCDCYTNCHLYCYYCGGADYAGRRHTYYDDRQPHVLRFFWTTI